MVFVHSHCCATVSTIRLQNSFHLANLKPCPLSDIPQPLAAAILPSVSVTWRSYTPHGSGAVESCSCLLGLAYFTALGVLQELELEALRLSLSDMHAARLELTQAHLQREKEAALAELRAELAGRHAQERALLQSRAHRELELVREEAGTLGGRPAGVVGGAWLLCCAWASVCDQASWSPPPPPSPPAPCALCQVAAQVPLNLAMRWLKVNLYDFILMFLGTFFVSTFCKNHT